MIDLVELAGRIKKLSLPDRFKLVASLIEAAKADTDREHAEQTLSIAHQIASDSAIEFGAALALRRRR